MLHTIPEELIERILALVIQGTALQAVTVFDFTTAQRITKTRTACLLTCRTLNRIALPLYYKDVHLQTRKQATLLVDTLSHIPHLRQFVHHVSAAGVWSEAGAVLQMCSATITGVEYTLDRQMVHSGMPQLTWGSPSALHMPITEADNGDVNAFCRALRSLRHVKALTVRKAPNLYVTSPRARTLIQELSKAVSQWPALTEVQILFSLPDDLDSDGLPHAIASRPHLRNLTTCLPSLWNKALLAISENTTLESISLLPSSSPRGSLDLTKAMPTLSIGNKKSGAILPNGLFLTQARKHSRLNELIARGTTFLHPLQC